MMKAGTAALLAAFSLVLVLAGCEKRMDRLITADGRVFAGDLESIDGRHVVFSDHEVHIDHEEGRVFLREGGASYRGRILFEGGSFHVDSGTGTVEIPAKEVASIIWSAPGQESSVTVEVPAAAGWVPTGLQVTVNDRICISATGRVSVETGTTGPSGIDYYSTAMALVPGATNGQLVMTVGEETPVAAGSLWTGDSPGAGEVHLAVNRPDRASVTRIGGSFTARVTRTPGASGRTVFYPAIR